MSKNKLIHKGVRLPKNYWDSLARLVDQELEDGQYSTQALHIRQAIKEYLKKKGVLKC